MWKWQNHQKVHLEYIYLDATSTVEFPGGHDQRIILIMFEKAQGKLKSAIDFTLPCWSAEGHVDEDTDWTCQKFDSETFEEHGTCVLNIIFFFT